MATVSAMMTKQGELGVAYLFQPLMLPLLQLVGGKVDKLITRIINNDRGTLLIHFPEKDVVNDDLNKLCASLKICLEDLYRVRIKKSIQYVSTFIQIKVTFYAQICTIVEPSSVFLAATLPYLPLIFDLWQRTKLSNSDFRYICSQQWASPIYT